MVKVHFLLLELRCARCFDDKILAKLKNLSLKLNIKKSANWDALYTNGKVLYEPAGDRLH